MVALNQDLWIYTIIKRKLVQWYLDRVHRHMTKVYESRCGQAEKHQDWWRTMVKHKFEGSGGPIFSGMYSEFDGFYTYSLQRFRILSVRVSFWKCQSQKLCIGFTHTET